MVKGRGRLASSRMRMDLGATPFSSGHVHGADAGGLHFPAVERAGGHPAQKIREQQRRRQLIFHRALAGIEAEHGQLMIASARHHQRTGG